MTDPILRTERLILAPHRLDDFAASFAMWSDPAVVRHIGGRPFTEEEVWARLHRYAGHWALLGFGYWAVRDATTGAFVGEVGFADFRRPIEPPFGSAPELGYAFVAASHGKGLAGEAVCAALAWGDTRFHQGRTVCLIAPENGASIRLAMRCGYREYARANYKDATTLLFERLTGGPLSSESPC